MLFPLDLKPKKSFSARGSSALSYDWMGSGEGRLFCNWEGSQQIQTTPIVFVTLPFVVETPSTMPDAVQGLSYVLEGLGGGSKKQNFDLQNFPTHFALGS